MAHLPGYPLPCPRHGVRGGVVTKDSLPVHWYRNLTQPLSLSANPKLPGCSVHKLTRTDRALIFCQWEFDSLKKIYLTQKLGQLTNISVSVERVRYETSFTVNILAFDGIGTCLAESSLMFFNKTRCVLIFFKSALRKRMLLSRGTKNLVQNRTECS